MSAKLNIFYNTNLLFETNRCIYATQFKLELHSAN